MRASVWSRLCCSSPSPRYTIGRHRSPWLRIPDYGGGLARQTRVNVNISRPCWLYPNAALTGVGEIRLLVGKIPYNFSTGPDNAKMTIAKPADGRWQFEVRTNSCEGPVIATMPLGAALGGQSADVCHAYPPNRSGP